MPYISRSFALMLALIVLVLSILGQDAPKKVTAEVTVFADDPVYKSLRVQSTGPAAFGGDYAVVNNLVLKKDAGTFTLTSGTLDVQAT